MRRAALLAAAVGGAIAGVLGLSACGGPDITQARVDDAIGPAFAHLYARQQFLLGKGTSGTPQASATCRRSAKSEANQGAGDDWVCQLLLQLAGPSSTYTYEVNVKADGCYSADGPPGLVGGLTITRPSGDNVVNPLFAFDGCFQTY